jgi:uncharacterized protein (TIGR00162 family)
MNTFHLKKLRNFPSKLNSPISVIGMPGIANVGKNTVINVVESLNADKIYEIFYQDFPAQVIVNKNGIITTPTASVYLSEGNSSNKDILLITGDFQPSTPKGIYDFSTNIADLLNSFNVELVISTGAYLSNKKVDSPKVYVSGTSNQLINEFLKFDNSILMEVGTISGANGLIPIISNKKFGIDGICLLAETNPMTVIDPLASKIIVEMLNKILNLNISVENLDKQIKKIDELLDQIKTQYQKKKSTASDTDFQQYIS